MSFPFYGSFHIRSMQFFLSFSLSSCKCIKSALCSSIHIFFLLLIEMQFACKNIISPHLILFPFYSLFVCKCKKKKKRKKFRWCWNRHSEFNWIGFLITTTNTSFSLNRISLCAAEQFYLQLLLIFRNAHNACEIWKWFLMKKSRKKNGQSSIGGIEMNGINVRTRNVNIYSFKHYFTEW